VSRDLVDMFAPFLSFEQIRLALEAFHEIKDATSQATALIDLAECMPEADRISSFNDALNLSSKIEDPLDRSNVLINLVPHLQCDAKRDALSKAVSAARDISNKSRWELGHARGWKRTKALRQIAINSDENEREDIFLEALASTLSCYKDNAYSHEAYSLMGPYLTQRLLNEAMTIIDLLPKKWTGLGCF
jgi:hypothetical protein